jgi:hypothetical protein
MVSRPWKGYVKLSRNVDKEVPFLGKNAERCKQEATVYHS